MREKLQELADTKRVVAVSFPAANGNKLSSITGTIVEVGDDWFILHDIYGNVLLVPLTGLSYIELKK
ncbi:MAG: hypothetical protein LIQ30_13085 [Planctomycetes bacterium]|nr:hypothetical protein [Planctomycetota bacterium]MCC8116238.1 hypothetical protein [Planctomycetota bacterium]MCD7897825.1 hypothetical protein [Planctomycetaceae bacterium]